MAFPASIARQSSPGRALSKVRIVAAVEASDCAQNCPGSEQEKRNQIGRE